MNVPDQRKMLYELMTSEERYQNFMNATTDAVFVHNFNGLILDVNNSACLSLGYTRQELINTYAWEVEIAITEETIKQNSRKLLDGPIQLEGRHRRKDGGTFPVDVRLSVFNSMGEPFVLAIVRDISEQKIAESTIKNLTHALDQSPILIIITDKEGTIEYVNKTVTTQTGYHYHEIVGHDSKIIQAGKIPEGVYSEMLKQLINGKDWRGTLQIKNKNGEYIEVSASISPIYDENDKDFTHYLTIMEILLPHCCPP